MSQELEKTNEKPKYSRLPVSLTPEDNALLIALQSAIMCRLGRRVSCAEIVRISLRSQAEIEGVSCQ